jgi:hypothetical protein
MSGSSGNNSTGVNGAGTQPPATAGTQSPATAGTQPPATAGARNNIEFVVKPRENLYLEGPIRKLPRVSENEPYSCQMGKTQQFNCLFRHYAKHNGLNKDDLVFYFTDELRPEETPETVHLMPGDEIWVERRKHDIEEIESDPFASAVIHDQFASLLPDGEYAGEHSDVKFILVKDSKEVLAHKAILLVRSEYFRAMFKSGGMRESDKNVFEVVDYSYESFRRMIEYVYTNTIRDIDSVDHEEVMELLMLANEYVLSDMKAFCEHAAKLKLNNENVCSFFLLSEQHNADALLKECQTYIRDHRDELKDVMPKALEPYIGRIGSLLLDTTLPTIAN